MRFKFVAKTSCDLIISSLTFAHSDWAIKRLKGERKNRGRLKGKIASHVHDGKIASCRPSIPQFGSVTRKAPLC